MNLDNTLWMGGILPGMTESQIMDSFKFFNVFPINIKFIRDKKKNKNKSFCFVTFKSFEDANNVLHYLNGKKIPNTEIIFRLNWADYQGSNKTVYVGGLHPNVTKDDLISFFRLQYKSVYNARIILDENGMSRGFGFVVFKSEEDYYKVIARGVRKINYYTYMAKAGGTGVEEKLSFKTMPITLRGTTYKMYYILEEEGKEIPVYYHDIVSWGMRAMKNNAMEAMRIFKKRQG